VSKRIARLAKNAPMTQSRRTGQSDERSVCRVYQMTIDDGEWTLCRDGAPFSQRFRATISEDGNTMTATRSGSAAWMSMLLIRSRAGSATLRPVLDRKRPPA
jgi:hypothetical protein